MFRLMKDFAKFSQICFSLEGVMIFPRLLMHVEDQKQERTTVSLRSAGSSADCTPCLKSFRRRRIRKELGETNESTDSANSSTAGSGSENEAWIPLSNQEIEVVREPSADALKRNEDENRTPEDIGFSRSVLKTVETQLLCSGYQSLNTEFESGKAANVYLEQTSAKLLALAEAAMAGLESSPYRLFKALGLDKLHAIEDGLLRKVADDTHKMFQSHVAYKTVPKDTEYCTQS
ncbi:hypothetical protein FGB62_361g03 [Gracilaria domingensis]|nr:hypothetical protein FGB62_361g03 [Gracilaria domingensis]